MVGYVVIDVAYKITYCVFFAIDHVLVFFVTIATIGAIFSLQFTKIVWTPVGELAALPIPSSWFRGVAPGEREGGRGGEKEGRKGREWRRGEGRGGSPRMPKSRVGKSIWWPLKISPPKGSSSFQMTDLPSCKLSCRSVLPVPRYLSPDT